MELFKYFKSPSEGVKKREKKEKGYGPEMTRRDFLRKSAKGASVFAGSALAGDFIQETVFLLERYSEEEEKNIKEETTGLVVEESTPEQKEIQEDDIKTLKEVLDFDREEKVEFNPETSQKIENHWKKRYSDPKDKLYDSFKSAYKNMGEWLPYLEQAFDKHGVPKKLIYLAIPESHWKINARSDASAVGPYQFIKSTANSRGLNTGKYKGDIPGIDERKDPIKSAEACAVELKDLFRRSGGDWDSALSGYNGNFINDYIIYARGKEEGKSYAGFCQFLEDKINNLRDTLKSPEVNNYEHRIRRGQTLGTICRYSGVDIDALCECNNIKDKNKVSRNQIIKIPLLDDQIRKNMFYWKVSGFKENLNYPAKFRAVIELIEEGVVSEQKSPINFDKVKVGKGEKQEYSYYKVKKGKGWYTIEKDTGVKRRYIEKLNPSIKGREPYAYEKLKVPIGSFKPETLRTIATKHKKTLDRLLYLNPAFKNENVEIPEGYIIRV